MAEIVALILLGFWTAFLVYDFKKAVIVLPVFFPLYLLKFQVGFVPFNVIEVMVYLTAIFLFGKFVKKRIEGSVNWVEKFKKLVLGDGGIFKDVKVRFFKLFLPAIVLALGSISGLYLSHLFGFTIPALGILKGWVLMPMLYGWIVIRVLENIEEKKATLYAYLVASLLLSLWGIYQAVTGDFITIDERASGPFESANYLALFIAPAFALSCILIWQRLEENFLEKYEDKSAIKRFFDKVKSLFVKIEVKEVLSPIFVFEWVCFILIGMALVASRSYGGILAVVGALVLYAAYVIFLSVYRNGYGGLLKKISIFIVIALIGITAFWTQMGTGKMNDFLAFDRQSSSSVRVQTWTITLKLIEENPFLGLGLGRFQTVYEERGAELLGVEPYEETMLHPHNLVLSTWANAGMAGVIALAWLIVAVFWSLKNKKLSIEERRFVALVITMFLVVLLHGVVDQPLWKNDLALIWWMIICLVM